MNINSFSIVVVLTFLFSSVKAWYSYECYWLDISGSRFGEYSLGHYELYRQYVDYMPSDPDKPCKGTVKVSEQMDNVVYIKAVEPEHTFDVMLSENYKGWGYIEDTETVVAWLYIDKVWQIIVICEPTGRTSLLFYLYKGGSSHEMADGDLGQMKAMIYETQYYFDWNNFYPFCS